MKAKELNLILDTHADKRASVVSNLFLIIGVVTMLAALIYMLVNLDKADSFIAVWIPFMTAGVLLSFWSILVRLKKR